MESTLTEIINNYGYIGIFLLIFVENIFPPIPSEVVLVFGGFLTTQSDMRVLPVIAAATAGAALGAAVLYLIGRLLDREKIKRLFSGRFGKTLRLKPSDVTRAEGWFKKFQYKAVLICRCIPIVRSLISIPAGMAKMRPLPFFLLTVIGTAVWNTALVLIGTLAGGAWQTSLKYFDLFSTAVIALLAAAAVAAAVLFVKKRFIDSRDDKDA
ncbi:MAG: DedA family protein [Oscillospiraceae bacterium]|jgi:alkaline phosphatase|nr:DedA family protein [Oscillospiraceae bacterium]